MNPGGLSSVACMGMTLSIGGVSLHTPAWQCLDLTSLWEPAALRGNDRMLPGVDGVIPYPRRVTVSSRSIPMVIVGGVDSSGTSYIDPNAPYGGLWQNVNYLATNVAGPVGGDGTRAASLTMPDTSVRSARVTVLNLAIGQHVQAGMLATLDFNIVGGRFT